MKQGEKVKAIRKTLNLTLEKFGERLGVSKGAISAIENNSRNLTNQMAKSICREFNVNYAWLMKGEGEMFSSDNEDIMQLIEHIMSGENEFHKNLMKSFATMSLDDLKALERVIDLCSSLKRESES